jgi:large subunit ribosomal protein L39e
VSIFSSLSAADWNTGFKKSSSWLETMAARKSSPRKIRLLKKTRQAAPVPAWVILRTKRTVRSNPKRRAWRSTDVEVG